MTEQELTDELTNLQQKRLDLAAKLDKETLQLQLWDKRISLLQELLATRQILVTLETRHEQEGAEITVTTSLGA